MIQPLLSQFTLTGKLKDFETKSKGVTKSLQLATENETYTIKIAEELNDKKLHKKFKKGCLLKVVGIRKNDPKKGKVKYKAYEIELLDKPTSFKESNNSVVSEKSDRSLKATRLKPGKTKAKVLFCKKSTCWKKGGEAAYKSLKAELRNRGIAEEVEVKTVGCLKQCKKAPNLVIMPDKARYSKVKATQVSGLIKKHILSK